MIDKANLESVSALAAQQKARYVSSAARTGPDPHLAQLDLTGTGELDPHRLRAALAATARHHAVLRSVFPLGPSGEPYQAVLRERTPQIEAVDYRDRDDPGQAVAEFKTADRGKGFDLGRDVLLRAAVLRVGDDHWHLVVTFHPIILDRESLAPLFRTWWEYYDELTRTASVTQRHETCSYAEYLTRYDGRPDDDEARRYWQRTLDGYERAAGLPVDRQGPGYRGATHRFELPGELHTGLVQLARKLTVTPASVLQTVWGVVLQKFNYTDDVVFGGAVSGRDTGGDGIEEMVGPLATIRPVRVTAAEDTDFAGLCRTVHAASLASHRYPRFPLHEAQSLTPLRGALLNHVIAVERDPLPERLREISGGNRSGPRVHDVEVSEPTSYDFALAVALGERPGVTFRYNAEVHSAALMVTLESCLLRVLASVARDAEVRVRDIAMWEPNPHTTAAPVDHSAALPVPLDATLVEAFDAVVRTHPDRTALVWRGTEYRYRALDRWSDALARTLTERGVGEGNGIGVLADRRPELVVALLAILKTGNYYVPVDTKDAPPRVESVLADAGVRHLCTVPEFADRTPGPVEPVLIEAARQDTAGGAAEGRAPGSSRRRSGSAYAYLMYTSGSTGKPKGCAITHRNVLRLFAGQEFMDFRAEQVVLFVNSPAFDASTLEIWGALLSGGTLVMPDDELDLLDTDLLRDTIQRHEVRNVTMPTVLFNQHCDQDPKIFAPLRYLCVVGSALSVRHVTAVAESCPDVKIVNGYGPTENTVFSTTHTVRAEDLRGDRVPIGRAVNHSTAYVLDNGLNGLPPGAVGELCVGGEGVSPGYHNRPELNREKFVTVAQRPGERLYRTGDLARELPDGTLDCLGRMDDQVKVRGFRVELGEVENALRAVDGVEEAVVIAVEQERGTQLAGYYVATDGTLTPGRVRRALSAALASYMIPVSLVRVERIPLNRNGKVDKEQLARLRPATRPDSARRGDGPESAH